MNNQDRADHDPKNKAAGLPAFHVLAPDDLAGFASEGDRVEQPIETNWSTQPLADFPEEGQALASTEADPAPASGWVAPVGAPGRSARVLSAAALVCILLGAFAGGWWLARLPWRGPAIEVASAPPPAAAPAIVPASSVQPQAPTPIEPKPNEAVPAVEPTPAPAVAAKNTAVVPPARERPTPTVASLPPAVNARVPIAPSRGREQTRNTPLGTSGARVADANAGLPPRPSTDPPAGGESRLTAPVIPAPPPMRAAAVEAPQAPLRQPEPAAASSALSTSPATAVQPAPEAFPAAAVVRTEQNEIQRALGQYRNAYDRLDASAARSVWPSVDVQALGRAFSSLTSQRLAFDSCLFDITGDNATAHCTGSATYTPKVGGRGPRSELRQWTFQLRKAPDGWKIQTAQIRRDD